jgi:hypothetical protein
MTYFGRADQARQYFIDLGFEPAHRQTTADFVVAGMLLSYVQGLSLIGLLFSSDGPHCSNRP